MVLLVSTAELPNARPTKQPPHVLNVSQFRGGPSDAMCLRCDSTCEFSRKVAAEKKQGDETAAEDVPKAHYENANFEALLAAMSGESADPDPKDERMWTFARPVEAYSAIWRQLGEITGAGTVVLVTGTASPNAILAAHAALAELHLAAERRLFVLAERVNTHAWYHGQAQLLAALRAYCMPSSSVIAPAPSQGKCLLTCLQFIHVAQEPSGADLADVPFKENALAGVDITLDIRTRPPSLLMSRVPNSSPTHLLGRASRFFWFFVFCFCFLVFVFCFSLRAAPSRLRRRRVGEGAVCK